MQRNQLKNNFVFDNRQVSNFLNRLEENTSFDLSTNITQNQLFENAKLSKDIIESESEIKESTPKNSKEIKIPKINKMKRMIKSRFESSNMIQDAKDLNNHYFDLSYYSNTLDNRNFLKEKISQSEKRNSNQYSNLINKSLEEADLKNKYLIFLGCQITPDLNTNTLFSKSSQMANKEKEHKSGVYLNNLNKIIEIPNDSNSFDFSNPYLKLNFNFTSELNNTKEEEKMIDCEKSIKKPYRLKKKKTFDNFERILLEESKKYDSTKKPNKNIYLNSEEIYIDQQNDLVNEISKILSEFNQSKEVLINYLEKQKSLYIECCDSDLNSFRIPISDFYNHFQRIDFNSNDIFVKWVENFYTKIIYIFIPSNVHFSKNFYKNDESEYGLKQFETKWRFSVNKKEENQSCKSLSLENIQILI